MRHGTILIPLMALTCIALADGLPVITSQTQNQTVFTGSTAPFFVNSTNATGFQWRFNGTDISGATNATLQITNAQSTNSGYYMVLTKNATGLTPSQLAYLSVVGGGSFVPFSNATNTGFDAQARDPGTFSPINDGIAQVLAGPTLDYMVPTGDTAAVTNGYFSLYPEDPGGSFTIVDNVSPGQTVYFRVTITYAGGTRTVESAVVQSIAGDGGTYPLPSGGNLKFPAWPEYPEPIAFPEQSPTNQARTLGETFTLSVTSFLGYPDFGIPTWQWRKDGNLIGNPQLFTYMPQEGFAIGNPSLTIANAQPSDAGIYDIVVLGNNWFVYRSATVGIQLTTNGPSVFASPRMNGSNFAVDLQGTPGREYQVQWTSNLSTWNNLVIMSNTTGTATFTDPLAPSGTRFYRATLLPWLFQ